MRKLGTITYDAFEFDDAVLEVTNQFNELCRANKTIEYKDITVTFGLFRRTWIILVYEYDDETFGEVELPEFVEEMKSAYIGIPPHIKPNDPDWQKKLEEWRRTVSSGS